MSEEKMWYFSTKGKAFGPFTEHELCKQYASGAFGSNDYVFCKGEMDKWVKADTVPGLCDTLALDAEPEPEHHAVPFYEKAALEHAIGEENVKKRREKRDKAYWERLKKKKSEKNNA